MNELKLIVSHDESFDPRDNDGILGTFLISYDMAELHRMEQQAKEFLTKKQYKEFSNCQGLVEKAEFLKTTNKFLLLKTWMLNHSSISFKAAEHNPFLYCGYYFDSCLAGYTVIPLKTLKNEYNIKNIDSETLNLIYDLINAELSDFTDYINGHIYQFRIMDADDNEIDCGGGYYGLTELLEALPEEMAKMFKKEQYPIDKELKIQQYENA